VQATTAGAAAANHDGDGFLGDDDETTSHQASAAAMTAAAAAAMMECGQEGSEEGLLPDEALAPLTVEALIQGFESLDPATQEAVNTCDIEVRVVVVVVVQLLFKARTWEHARFLFSSGLFLIHLDFVNYP
jgi:hypothetical protein